MSINEAETIKNKILNNNHYSNCFNGNDLENFKQQNNKLGRIRSCYDAMNSFENLIIDIFYKNKNIETKLNNQNELSKNNLNSEKIENENNLKIEEKKKQNEINDMRKQLEISKLKNENEIKLINEELLKLEKENKE